MKSQNNYQIKSPTTPGPHDVTLKPGNTSGEWLLKIEQLLVADTVPYLKYEAVERNNTIRIGGVGYIYGKGIRLAVPDNSPPPFYEEDFSGATKAEQAGCLAGLIEKYKVASGLEAFDILYTDGDDFITFKQSTEGALVEPWFLYSQFEPGTGFYTKGRPWRNWGNPAFRKIETAEPWYEVFKIP